MKINKIELKNYRIHKEYQQEFENGINLLLGNNGSGKSSILEAIGFALFDSDARSKQADIVSIGEKNGSVKVSFEGSDEKEYEIERKFGNSPSANLTCLDSLQKWNGKEEVYKQVGKILDLDNVKDGFFESVICAKQNQFIDIFTLSDAERTKHFDKLFDTEIYNDLWKKLGEQNEKKYEDDRKIKEERRRTIAERQKNIAELENELRKQSMEFSNEIKKQESLENELKNKENELDKYRKQKELLNSKETELKNSKNNIERFTKAKEYDKLSLGESQKAKKFLEDNKIKFDEYVSAKKQNDILEKDLLPLRNAAKNYEELQKYALSCGMCPILNIPCGSISKSNTAKLQELEQKIAKAKQNKEQAEKLRNEIDDIKIKTLNPNQNIYIQCLQNKKTADEYEMRKRRLAENEKNIQIEMEKTDRLNKELSELKANFSEEQLKLKEEAVNNLKNLWRGVFEKTTGLKKDIEQKKKEIEEHKRIEQEILNLDSEIAIIRQKLELTKIFREKIKDLGRIVAEERVLHIAGIASDYFNKITSRPESILWVCSESEKYSLYLDNGKARCSFVNLSGGEQISVAIAIRLALSQEFGNTGLIILDEPTNNLDQNKRQLLAENLPKMVENLTQLFVVTHDDTFRNSATKVIEF